MSPKMFDLFLKLVIMDEPRGWTKFDNTLFAGVIAFFAVAVGSIYA